MPFHVVAIFRTAMHDSPSLHVDANMTDRTSRDQVTVLTTTDMTLIASDNDHQKYLDHDQYNLCHLGFVYRLFMASVGCLNIRSLEIVSFMMIVLS